MRRLPRVQGFGLAEILIAIALFSTAFLYLMSSLTLSNHSLKHSADRIYAHDLAQRVLEDQKSLPYANLVDFQGVSSVRYNQNGQDTLLQYSYFVDVTEVPVASTGRTMKNLAVRVEWFNRYMPSEQSRTRSVLLETAVGP